MKTIPLTAVLIGVLLSLQFALWIGDKNVVDLWRLQNSITEAGNENEALTQRNRDLAAEVVSLKGDLGALEDRARQELGMIKKGETFFQVIEE